MQYYFILLSKCLRELGYHQEPVSKETMEISLFNQINLTTDKECSQISILGITVIIKRKSSQHLEMKLSSLTIFINMPVSMVLTFSVCFLLAITKASPG